jgi:hypothetical protein
LNLYTLFEAAYFANRATYPRAFLGCVELNLPVIPKGSTLGRKPQSSKKVEQCGPKVYRKKRVDPSGIEEGGDLSMGALLGALGDRTRQQIVSRLSIELATGTSFRELGLKIAIQLSLRSIAQNRVDSHEKAGDEHLMSLRLREVKAVFPGFLEAVLKGIAAERLSDRMPPRVPPGRNMPSIPGK